jgi:hypothetical protein
MTFSRADLGGLRVSVLVHATGGLLVLLTVATLAIYKPAGLTPFGVRKQREPSAVGLRSDIEVAIDTPRWVKIFVAVVIVMILMIGIMMLAGEHGPSAHISAHG